MFRSDINPMFRSKFSEDIFNAKYAHERCETWAALASTLVWDVCGQWLTTNELQALTKLIADLKFIPGGRYLYYAGRPKKFFNNCYLLRAEEDTREDWANLSWRVESCLMTGGGIGVDYSIYRPSGMRLSQTGGLSSGPIPKMKMINEIGRNVMQGGSRRSAIYASLGWQHGDVHDFLKVKNWHDMKVPGSNITLADAKQSDFNFPCPLDMTNVSVNYDTAWLMHYWKTGELGEVFIKNVEQALSTAEPGFSFNFFEKENETLRNAPVAADTHILTPDGYRTVGETLGQTVTVWTGVRWAETQFHCTKYDTPTVTVKMTGMREITCDPEHEFLVRRYTGRGAQRRLAIERVPASRLKQHDAIHVVLPTPVPQPLDKRFYTLGFAYGDGSFARGKADITICDESKAPCEEVFAGMCKQGHDSRGYRRYYWDSELCSVDGKDNPYAPLEKVPSFLAGLFDADGSYDSRFKSIRLSSSNLTMLTCIRRMLESIGIQSTINANGASGYSDNTNYLLVILRSSNTRFAETIPTQRLKVEHHDAYRISEIRVESVTPGPVVDVFCCDVGYEEHSFLAEGVLISNCTEVTSEDDSDVCNLGSLNLGRIDTLEEFKDAVELATLFLLCGTMRADLPYSKVYEVREKNRRLGLGLMGVHEWLLKRGYRYEVTPELHRWLAVYRGVSNDVGDTFADSLSISRPIAKRAVAPTGTIGILAGTSTGIEPIFAVAYKRRYLRNGTKWHYQYVVDSAAQELIDLYGLDPEKVESALDLAGDYERRIRFQADVQDYVDQAISSTINLPKWGSRLNNPDTAGKFAATLAQYAPRLRGFTCYPDGARGGQPLTSVSYAEARSQLGQEFREAVETHDVCSITGHGGSCGV